jgi:enoyl-CoA hydratase/carnithine racemase
MAETSRSRRGKLIARPKESTTIAFSLPRLMKVHEKVVAKADILISTEGGIATVTLNRPRVRNAIRLAMWRELASIFSELSAAEDIRAIILTGSGGHFSAGADISEFSSMRADAESGRRYEACAEAALLALRDCRKPTIAAISGYALGGGCSLAMGCDLRVGEGSTRMGIPAARLGIVYSKLECELLYRQVGLANAKRVLYCGRPFAGEECAAMRLIDVLAPDASAQAQALAEEIAENAPLSLAGHKLVLEALATGTADDRETEISAHIDRAMGSADYREATQAFLEKRKPVFSGR